VPCFRPSFYEEEEVMEDLEYRLKAYKLFDKHQKLWKTFLKANGSYEERVFWDTDRFLSAERYPKETLIHFVDVLGDIPVLKYCQKKKIATIITLEERLSSFSSHWPTRELFFRKW
jgi:hypothetical protein